jgi:hypothetical protein
MKTSQQTKSDASVWITNYIEGLGDWRAATLARAREVILSAGPEVTEAWKWDHPVWEANGNIVVAGAFKGKVKLTFARGAKLKDPKRLFNAGLKGGTWRAIDFHEGDKVNAVGLKALVRDAVALNAVSKRGIKK